MGRHFELQKSEGEENIQQTIAAYRENLQKGNTVDLADIVQQVLLLWEREPEWLEVHRKRYAYLAVDEFQDINPLQYRFLEWLGKHKKRIGHRRPGSSQSTGSGDRMSGCFSSLKRHSKPG